MAGGGGGGNGEPEFQIAPMLDMLLVLLMFFMSITTAQTLKIDSNIKLPLAKNGEKREDKAKAVLLNVSWDQTLGEAKVKLDDIPLDLSDKEKCIEMIASRAINPFTKKVDPEIRLLIRADKNVTAKYIQDVLFLGAEAGMDNIAFTGQNQEE
ncbi:MAG: biopolymer transporter ExbD [Opitutales bacterium]|nr:biopolymer transporter ExbD [Opitutales bacterium]